MFAPWIHGLNRQQNKTKSKSKHPLSGGSENHQKKNQGTKTWNEYFISRKIIKIKQTKQKKNDENDYLTRVNARCYERDTLKQRRNNHQWWKQWWKMIVNQQFHRCWWWWWSNKIYLFFFQKINKPERQWNCKNSTHK